jgi:hypothetical protein
MNSRANNQQVRGQTSPARPAAPPKQLSIRDLLRERAIKTTGVTALYCSAAALQVDCVSPSPVHGEIARKIAGRWAGLAARDRRDLDQAKLNLVRRLGEAARVIGGNQAADPGYPGKPAYREIYDIAVAESSEAIRRECAHQIGVNGDAAFNALQGLLGPGDPASPGRKTEAEPGPESDAHPAVTAADGQAQVAEADDRYWREQAVRAWLAPLFAGSVTRGTADAQKNLAEWLRFVSEHGDRATRGQLLSVEVALTQGFKYAANRCGPPPHANPQAYAVLTEQAREMLKRTGFWYSQLTLIHALCLLSLSGSRSQQSANGRDADYAALVTHWAEVSKSRSEHPFVTEARHLAVWVLETGQPERFMWIDESSVAATVGSGPGGPHAPHWQDAWIPPTAGWAALHGRAQKLLGDVLILLNLADRGAGPRDRDQYLLRVAPAFLPPCLSRDRSPLDPGRTIGSAAPAPGSHCMAGCPFDLCPYPSQGERNRAELSEAFCRRQRTLVRGRGRRAADLKRFWADMAQRVQP